MPTATGMVPNNMYNGNISAGGTDIGNIGNGALYADAAAQSYWEAYWNAIWNCSYFISRIGTANVDSESDRQRWKAEAHVLRAYYYMLLLRLYGPSLPMDTPYNMADDFSGLTPASITDLTDFILSDCDSAINTDAFAMENHYQCRAAARHQGGCMGDQVARDALCGQSVI